MKLEITNKMKIINDFFKDIKFYYVGGCVRDMVMGNEPKDYDLITPLTPDKVEEYIKSKGRKVWKQGAKFGTLGVKLEGEVIEITTYRTEDYQEANRKPEVRYTESLNEDLSRRDFTINTLVCDLNGNIKNIFGGLEDIQAGIIRAVGIPKLRFKEDPLRILRGIRFCVKYDFIFDEATYKKLVSSRWRLLEISKERIVDEMNKILRFDGAGLLFHSKIFQVIIPHLHLQVDYDQHNPHHDFTLEKHTCITVGHIAQEYKEPKYLWAGLLHDVAKPYVAFWHKSGERKNYVNHEILGAVMADEICRNLKMSNDDRKFIVESVRDHILPESWMKKHDDNSKKVI